MVSTHVSAISQSGGVSAHNPVHRHPSDRTATMLSPANRRPTRLLVRAFPFRNDKSSQRQRVRPRDRYTLPAAPWLSWTSKADRHLSSAARHPGRPQGDAAVILVEPGAKGRHLLSSAARHSGQPQGDASVPVVDQDVSRAGQGGGGGRFGHLALRSRPHARRGQELVR